MTTEPVQELLGHICDEACPLSPVVDGWPSRRFGAVLYGVNEGGIETDEAGLETVRNLGRRIAEVTLKLNGTNRTTS